MKINKNKIFGAISLAVLSAVVASISVFYHPAKAEDGSMGFTDTIKVIVYDRFPAISIKTPADSSITTDSDLYISFDYENVNNVKFILDYDVEEDGELVHHTRTIATFEPNPETLDPDLYITESGSRTIGPINLDAYRKYGTYTLTAVAKGVHEYEEDIVQFSYYPFKISANGVAENKDPIVRVDYAKEVAEFALQVYDEKDRAVFDEPIYYEVGEDKTDFYKDITLLFASYGLKDGKYQVVVAGKSIMGDDLGPIAEYINYVAPAPDVPKTGLFTKGLDIAAEDCLITSLIIFVIVFAFSIRLLTKKQPAKRRARRR